MSMNNAALEAALRAAMVRLTSALAGRDAPNSLKLEGKTLAEVTTLILAGTAANANLFDGKTYQQVVDAITGGSSSTVQAVEAALAAFIARRDNPHVVTKDQVGLGLVQNLGVASQAEAEAGAADKYITADMAKHLVQLGVDALVGAAPGTLDTINEIAAALQNDPDIINNLMTEIGTKETPAGAQAKADGAKTAAVAEANAYADTKAAGSNAYADQVGADTLASAQQYADSAVNAATVRATQAEAEGGTDNVKLMTALRVAQAIALQGGALFLGKTAQATDSARLEGQTLAQVLAAAEAAAAAGTSANALKLEGKTLAEVIALAQDGVDMSNVVLKTDDFGQYLVGGTALSTLLADLASGADLATLQSSFNAFVAAKATGAEVIAGTDDSKYVTSLAAKTAIDAAVAALVDAAPEALNTINELAAALNNDPDIINTLMTQIGQKLGATAQAVDSAKLEGQTLAQVIAAAQAGKAATAGTADNALALGGVVAADYALKTYVDTGMADTLEAVTEGFIANALDLSSMFSGNLTVADLGAGRYGFGASGALAPATFNGITISGFSWTAAVVELVLDGDQTATTIDALMIGTNVINAFVSRAFAGGKTTYSFTNDKTLPVSGSAAVKF